MNTTEKEEAIKILLDLKNHSVLEIPDEECEKMLGPYWREIVSLYSKHLF